MEGAQCDGAAFGGSGGLGPGTASMSFADVLRGSAVDRGLDLGSEARGAAEEWDEDSDEDEENDWRVEAKEVMSKLKKNRDCQLYFCVPVRSS